MRRCTSQTGSSPLWYSTSSTPNSVVPRPKRAMLAREWRSTASNVRASTTQSMSPMSPGAVVLDAIIRRNLLGSRNVSRIGVSRILDIFPGGANMVADVGLLALRVALGLVFLAHGAQKAFGA